MVQRNLVSDQGTAHYATSYPSVRLSVTGVDQSKTVEIKIMQFLPHSSPITTVYFSQDNFYPKILTGSI